MPKKKIYHLFPLLLTFLTSPSLSTCHSPILTFLFSTASTSSSGYIDASFLLINFGATFYCRHFHQSVVAIHLLCSFYQFIIVCLTIEILWSYKQIHKHQFPLVAFCRRFLLSGGRGEESWWYIYIYIYIYIYMLVCGCIAIVFMLVYFQYFFIKSSSVVLLDLSFYLYIGILT